MYNVMIVDDDELVLKSIKRVLKMCNDLEVEYFTSPVDALKRCQTMVFDVIVSDYRMPENNGVDFLVRVKEIQPEAVRVILSAQVDTGVLTSAINDAAIFKLIVKPWKNVSTFCAWPSWAKSERTMTLS